MKLAIVTLLLSTVAFAAPKVVEFGTYKAVDVETGEVKATLIVRENKTLNFNVTTPDFTMPAPGCEGNYTVVENTFISDLECPHIFLPEAHVEIDITAVTPESVRSAEGVNVNVKIDALGDDAFLFNLKKVE